MTPFKIVEKLKTLLTHPITLIGIAALLALSAFRVPEFADYLLGGAIITLTQSFVAVAVLLASVWLSRHARAAFSKGNPRATLPQSIIICGAYISCAVVIAAVLLAN